MEGMFTFEWFTALGGILLLDLILSGDNAIVIALACKNLPDTQKWRAMLVGGFGAVMLRIVLTLFATSLLSIAYLQFLGGLALLYIAVKLLVDQDGDADGGRKKPATFLAAVKTILIADFIMSMDNILSMAGLANTVSSGKWSLIICGLLVSIPIVLCGAQLFLLLLQRVPVIIYAGAGILAFTAGKMMVLDQALGAYFAPWAGLMESLMVCMVLFWGWYQNHRSPVPVHESIKNK